jgi:hypothetical protein
MVKYGNLARSYRKHFVRFNEMLCRANRLGLECDFERTYDSLEQFIVCMGPIPENISRPSVGRVDHSKGYVFDIEKNRWNFAWQSVADNSSEAARRTKLGKRLSNYHKGALSKAAKNKFQTTDAAQKHSKKIKEIWKEPEGRRIYLDALQSPSALDKKSAKMKEHWRDESKRETWKKSLSEGQKQAWANGRYAGKSGFLIKEKCPWCGKEGSKAVLKRWHFANCKQNPTKSRSPLATAKRYLMAA